MANPVLFQWGPIQFQVFPLSVNDYAHHTASEWAKKEIAGAALYREWVGEGEEMITVKGRVFPHWFARQMRRSVDPNTGRRRDIRQPVYDSSGASIDPETAMLREQTGGFPSAGGLMHLDVLDNMRRLGQAHILIRGDGWHFGWYVIENLNRAHSHIHRDGIGQQIDFEAQFQRVPIPNDPAMGIIQIYDSGAAGNSASNSDGVVSA
jgi:uncharacterized protein